MPYEYHNRVGLVLIDPDVLELEFALTALGQVTPDIEEIVGLRVAGYVSLFKIIRVLAYYVGYLDISLLIIYILPTL